MGAHDGVQKIGGTVIPTSSGNTRQIQLMEDFGSTAVACTPSYALYMAEEIRKQGINIKSLKLKVGIFGRAMDKCHAQGLEEKLNIKAMTFTDF